MNSDLCYPSPPDVMGDEIPSDQFPWPLQPWEWPQPGDEAWNAMGEVMA